MSLLPSESDASGVEDSTPRVIGVDDEAAEDLIAALSSETARAILTTLHEEPAPPSRLAERVETSLQNVQYHLETLREAGAVEVIDTAYSEKGREMDVYAPADRPLVIFAGEQSRTHSIRDALMRLLGGVGVLGIASLLVQSLYGDRGGIGFGGAPSDDVAANTTTTGVETDDVGRQPGTITETTVESGDATEPTATVVETTTPTDPPIETTTQTDLPIETTRSPVETATQTVTETIDTVTTVAPDGAGLPPGLVFFAGGLTAISVTVALWYVWQ